MVKIQANEEQSNREYPYIHYLSALILCRVAGADREFLVIKNVSIHHLSDILRILIDVLCLPRVNRERLLDT